MALTGKSNEEKIWNYLIARGLSKCGAAGLMGNIYAESALKPTNLQNSFEKKLGYTDESYIRRSRQRLLRKLCQGQRRLRPVSVDVLEPETEFT